ncbi:MAG: DNA replication/repair protein RecF [Alphaproteobacteria bacterium]|nr:DNA replication/repair protein RecF [Alphaproteobacteria bacterium]
MLITRLTLTDFRNHAALRMEPARPLICLYGPNGAGKTNILEAVSLLVPGRGLRGQDFHLLARLEGAGAWAVAAEAQTPLGEVRLGTSHDGGEATTRKVAVDGMLQKSSGVLGHYLKMLWLTPAQDRLFMGPGGDRRRFFDRMVSSFNEGHAAHVSAFEKLMKERNALLQQPRPDATWLSTLETQMAEQAVAMAAARNEAAGVLARHFASGDAQGPFPWGVLQLHGQIEELVSQKPAVQAEDEYAKILADSRGADRAAQRTLNGPHRSDFSVLHGPKSTPAELCSTGEQKALLIGLTLAQARAAREMLGASPILLLDEVAAHLDQARRRGLFQVLSDLGAQAWMTGTDENLFAEAGAAACRFEVKDGTVHVRQ